MALVATLLGGCYGIRVSFDVPPRPPYKELTRARMRGDDLALDGLRRAAAASKTFFERSKAKPSFTLGHDTYTFTQLEQSIDRFMWLVDNTPPDELSRRLARECRAYAPRGGGHMTAYYEPVILASRKPDSRFRYPLYQKPDELTLVQLGRFFPGDDRRIHGRVQGGELLPYLTREQIDGRNLLAGRGLELAWVDDPVARYFLHVQGSGRLRLREGGTLRVNYAASNGLPYTSVGRYMLEKGILGPNQGSSRSIRTYLSANPETRDQILFRNPRYIFFRTVDLAPDEGPVGSLGVPLVPGRSLATDRRFVPPGVVTYISGEKPLVDGEGALVGWESFSRFAFSHDSGAAIKGPGRIDIYWGEGENAGAAAGYMNRTGQMLVLMCGVSPGNALMAKTVAPAKRAFTQVANTELAHTLATISQTGL